VDRVDQIMKEGLSEGVFPGAQLLVSRQGEILAEEVYGHANLFSREPVTRETVFDLASLTKPLATTLAVMELVAGNRMALDEPLGSVLFEALPTDKADIRMDQLLAHVAGLPAYRPYYKSLGTEAAADRRIRLLEKLLAEPLVCRQEEKTIYSDLGFMLLCEAVERRSGMRLDCFVEKRLYRPLGIRDLFFVPTDEPGPKRPYAATAYCPWRRELLEGVVHDENAYVQGGVCGHAGLFGTAEAVHTLLASFFLKSGEAGKLFPEPLLDRFLHPGPVLERALGFDLPSKTGSSSGSLFDPETTFGHLGFTGVSFWMEFSRRIIVILLTNRIHPVCTNDRIKAFRPRLHDAIMTEF
jgi:CubicO group peptidase (beta-lactamase class C family)